MNDMKAASKGQQIEGNVDLSKIDRVVFACDAGMGSSAMGASVLQRKFEGVGVNDVKVEHYSVSEVPTGVRYVVCHQDLVERAKKSAPGARIVTITNFMNAPEYDQIVGEIAAARSGVGTPSTAQQTVAKASVSSDSKVLLKKNIILNRPNMTKEEVIADIGRIMERDGYATANYTKAMLEKEKVFNTAIGNHLAVPHGIEEMRSEILGSGLTIFTFPGGIDWGDGEIVKLVVGIASTGDEHIEVLGRIAEVCETEEAVDKIMTMSVDEVYDLFKR
ncbi:MAG: PTS sugar transporter subunit IIA, partial [Lachnospiraceae bacterium]|nr:PTS sugar transporter subunit IIA [Lachnospiraceae bacterium]